MKKNEFKCHRCKNVYIKGWSDEEAEKEYVENFGEIMAHGEDRVEVCDECYQLIRPDKHPDKMEMARANFFKQLQRKGLIDINN